MIGSGKVLRRAEMSERTTIPIDKVEHERLQFLRIGSRLAGDGFLSPYEPIAAAGTAQ